MTNPHEELQAIDLRLNSEPLSTVHHRLSALKQILRVFQGNWNELRTALAQLDGPAEAFSLFDVRNREGMDRFLDEVDRLLHNFVASAASLVDHTRRHVRSQYPEGSQVRDQYESGVKERFAAWPIASIVKDLRNLTLHRELPLSLVQMSWERDRDVDIGVILPTEPLLEWERWSPVSRRYLEAATGEGLRLDRVVEEYGRRVAEFYAWFGAFQVIHDLEGVRELDRLIQQRNELTETLRNAFGL